jgi:hypothetical protein
MRQEMTNRTGSSERAVSFSVRKKRRELSPGIFSGWRTAGRSMQPSTRLVVVTSSSARCEVSIDGDLPYVDEHAITIAVPRDLVWTALWRYATTSIGVSGGNPLARILGTAPRSGFEVAEAVPPARLILAGRHRFSRYALVFELHDRADDSTVLRAKTYAVFPGPHGRMYRVLVIGTRVHVLATSHMLRAVRRLSLRLTSP